MTHYESAGFRWRGRLCFMIGEIVFQVKLYSTGIIQCSTAINIRLVK